MFAACPQNENFKLLVKIKFLTDAGDISRFPWGYLFGQLWPHYKNILSDAKVNMVIYAPKNFRTGTIINIINKIDNYNIIFYKKNFRTGTKILKQTVYEGYGFCGFKLRWTDEIKFI